MNKSELIDAVAKKTNMTKKQAEAAINATLDAIGDALAAKKPEKVVELAVKGMLPKGPLGAAMYKKLFVYAGPEHNHQAQQPESLTF